MSFDLRESGGFFLTLGEEKGENEGQSCLNSQICEILTFEK